MADQCACEESLRPFDARMLDVGQGHWLYVEEVGRHDGSPALFLHGGPGSGAQHAHRRLFDPSLHRAILFDQRGAGRSHPYLSVAANTTTHLISDIERIREHFGIEKWLLVGGSWGSTLALAYAERFPHRVTGIVLRAVFLGTRAEVEWAFIDGPRRFRPELFAEFVTLLPEAERADPLNAYLERLANPDNAIHGPAARIWSAYERALSELTPGQTKLSPPLSDDGRLPPTPLIEAHYIRHGFFLEPNDLLGNAVRLHGIPGVIVQGRYDLLCPPASAHALAAAWPGCRLLLMEGAGHALTENGVAAAMSEAVRSLTGRD
jgi:proline iminopeptidase